MYDAPGRPTKTESSAIDTRTPRESTIIISQVYSGLPWQIPTAQHVAAVYQAVTPNVNFRGSEDYAQSVGATEITAYRICGIVVRERLFGGNASALLGVRSRKPSFAGKEHNSV
jgi:hypothetical protein